MISKTINASTKGVESCRQKLVAVAVPVSNRVSLTPDEQISLNHLLHFLGAYDKYFVAPEGLEIHHPDLENKYFGLEFFGSAKAHSQLLLSSTFYEAFSDYDYVLIYHLDALVFSDQLTEWCNKGYDYIAPPWIKHDDAPYAGKTNFEGKIGNGGYSLRKVESFLEVINSRIGRAPVLCVSESTELAEKTAISIAPL